MCYNVGMNRAPFDNDECYHIYNRGVDKRNIVMSGYDLDRFLKSMEFFNDIDPIVSLYSLSFEEQSTRKKRKPLVDILVYCINPNHYHMILRQIVNGGISEFMKRLNGGYTRYFNHRYKRSGALLQGRFKSKYIGSEEYLLRVSAYVNLNNRVHQLSGSTTKLVRSSWQEYADQVSGLCDTSFILKQFQNSSYKDYALEALPQMIRDKILNKELASMLID